MPSTEAGTRLADRLRTGQIIFPADIDDIEAEAVADERKRITREVKAIPNLSPFPSDAPYVTRAAVLAIVNGEDTHAAIAIKREAGDAAP